jgi:glycosyltransferase involved in cell wall biosynthesis
MLSPLLPPKVAVCHPGRQHSHQLAMALADRGMLAKYITGVPAHPGAMTIWSRGLMGRWLSNYTIDIDSSLVSHILAAPIIRRIAGRFGSPPTAVDWAHRGDAVFDWLAARQVRKLKPDIVVCYENAALESFRSAKQMGVTTVLDAASFHHAWQDRFHDPVESQSAHDRITRRKDEEIGLADFVLTVSDLAKQSYVDAGIDERSICSIPVGAQLTSFTPSSDVGNRLSTPRFIFVGNASRLKGIDILETACRFLNANGQMVELTIVGNSGQLAGWHGVSHVRGLGRIDHKSLPAVLREHDVLILPSRFDSFGMVVAEAMACGLPVIATENVGAKEMIIQDVTGLVIPAADASALAKAMGWFIANRSRLPAMSQAARKVAENYDWAHYRRRAIDFFDSLHSLAGNCG